MSDIFHNGEMKMAMNCINVTMYDDHRFQTCTMEKGDEFHHVNINE